jgi:transcriptional regulator with XRE-family HTH domain
MTELRLATQQGAVPEWTIGWRLQRALGYAGIAAGDMAVELQVSRATVSRWLNDKGLPPRWVYLERWAELTGVSALWLCHGDVDPCGPRPAVTWGNGSPAPLAKMMQTLQTYGVA